MKSLLASSVLCPRHRPPRGAPHPFALPESRALEDRMPFRFPSTFIPLWNPPALGAFFPQSEQPTFSRKKRPKG